MTHYPFEDVRPYGLMLASPTVISEVVDVKNERVLSEIVRTWAQRQACCDAGAAERAASVAVRTYEGGASVTEACQAARAFVRSCSLHPSHLAVAKAPSALAS